MQNVTQAVAVVCRALFLQESVEISGRRVAIAGLRRRGYA